MFTGFLVVVSTLSFWIGESTLGAVPASLVRSFTWQSLGELGLAAALALAAATVLFQRGLVRYQSGSAVQARL